MNQDDLNQKLSKIAYLAKNLLDQERSGTRKDQYAVRKLLESELADVSFYKESFFSEAAE